MGYRFSLERVLAPTLRPGQVVVRDNFASHKGEKVRELIQGRGCGLLPAPLLARLQPDRGGIREGQDAAGQGQGPHPRGIGGGARRGPRLGHGPRRPRLLKAALRLPPSGSTTMTDTVRAWWLTLLAPVLVGVLATAIVWATPLATLVVPNNVGS